MARPMFIARVQRPGGTFPEVGMNDQVPMRCTERAARRRAKAIATDRKRPVRLVLWNGQYGPYERETIIGHFD